MACGLGSQDDDDGNKAVEAIKKQVSQSTVAKKESPAYESDF